VFCQGLDRTYTPVQIELQDFTAYQVVCERGHVSHLMIQLFPFELLFDSGTLAFLDGYYREAVGSFAAALERFYELAVRVLLRARGLEDAEIGQLWKVMSRQSERQIGAYVTLYGSDFRELAPLLSDKATAFRNEVIHKGRFPKREEAAEFGEAVLQVIWRASKSLRDRLSVELERELSALGMKSDKPPMAGLIVGTLDVRSMVNMRAPIEAHGTESFAEALERFEQDRQLVYPRRG
jgi:hypothetical protein